MAHSSSISYPGSVSGNLFDITSTGKQSSPTNRNAGSTRGTDQTSVSSTGSSLFSSLCGGDSDVRNEHVAAIHKAITSGTYNVSAGAVADKLISFMLQ